MPFAHDADEPLVIQMLGRASPTEPAPADLGCKVTWESEFEVVRAPAAEIEGAIQGLFEMGLSHLRTLLDAAD